MQKKKVFVTCFRIAVVCLLFAICMAIGGAVSGLGRVAQQEAPDRASSQAPSAAVQPEPALSQPPAKNQPVPGNLLFPFLTFSICVGAVASYLILRSSWHGWMLAIAMFVGMYGISTVATQIESLVFLSNKLPHGMMRAIFVQGAIATALFAPLAVLLLGKGREATAGVVSSAPPRRSAASMAWRIAVLVFAFVFLYLFFGYFVAWQNPELRRYYGGPEWPTFFDSLKGNWLNSRWIFPLQVFRALLYVAFMYPLIRMLHVARWESALVTALFLSAWTTILLLPNPLMPPSVARSHFWETLGFSLVFGTLLGWFLSLPRPTVGRSAPATT
jgi:hypothetical protein